MYHKQDIACTTNLMLCDVKASKCLNLGQRDKLCSHQKVSMIRTDLGKVNNLCTHFT
jgi:hypothetical protein